MFRDEPKHRVMDEALLPGSARGVIVGSVILGEESVFEIVFVDRSDRSKHSLYLR